MRFRKTALLRKLRGDPATKMNQNLSFAQAVPGMNTGRGTGMFEKRARPEKQKRGP